MKNLILFTSLVFATSSFAFEKSMNAVVRKKNGRAKTDTVILKDLISNEGFDGEHFIIVKGKESEAVKFNDPDKELVLRASTVYHHLTLARNYFINHVKSTYVADQKKMIIRVDHKNQFSELGHFANDNMEPQYNNALTVPAGKGLERKGVKPWGIEIWFRPRKNVNLRDLKVNDLGNREMKVLMQSFRNQIHMQSLQRFLAQSVTAFVSDNAVAVSNPFSLDAIIRTAGSSIIMEFGYQFIDPISRATARKWYWLDTALVPEIIYHEYSHAALSDYLVLSHSTAIIEGMADFFAGQIANSPKLAKKIKKYNTYNGKNAKRKQQYMTEFEMQEYANTDFVFGLLWQMKKVVGEDQGEAFMFELRKKLTTNSTIRGQLVDGLVDTCNEVCKDPFNDSMRILKALNDRGM